MTPQQETTKNNNSSANTSVPSCCTPPTQLFSVAVSLSAFLYANLNLTDLQTMYNLFDLVSDMLSSFVSQELLCKGNAVISQTTTTRTEDE